MKNKMEDLRNHLFATIESLSDDEKLMDLDRAKTISDVAQTLINTAKVEVDLIKATGQQRDSGFITSEKPALPGVGQRQIGRGVQ